MRVLYLNVEEKIAGAEKSLLLSLKALRQKCEVVLVCPSGQLSRAAVSRGITWKRLPASPRSKWFSLKGLIYIIKLSFLQFLILSKEKPDIVHVSNIITAYASWLPCFITRIKFVFHVRDDPRRQQAYRFIGPRASGFIAISEFIRSRLINIGIPEDSIFIVCNPLEELADDQIGFSGLQDGDKNYTYANIGQLVPWKRQEIFIEAAKIVAERQPNASFWVVGDDIFERNSSYRDYILRKIENSSLENRIVFKGWQDDMFELWNQIDCLVHTAVNEPFGRVIIEAMQASVPVVASGTGGPAEIIQDDITGTLVDGDEPDMFALAMLKTSSDTKKTFEMVKNAKRYVSQKFSLSATSDALICVYKRVLQK